MKFVLLYETTSEEALKDIIVGVSIRTPGNMFVTNFGMTETGHRLNFESRKAGRLECIVPKLSLNAGQFYYSLIARSARAGDEIEDWIQQAGMFDVEPGDYYGSGRIPGKQVLMLIDHEWRIIEQEKV